MMAYGKRYAEKIRGLYSPRVWRPSLAERERILRLLLASTAGNGGWEWRPAALKAAGYEPLVPPRT